MGGGDFLDWLAKQAPWAWLIVVAIWGGTAAHIERMREHNLKFTLIGLIGDWVISGFVGIITAYACVSMNWDFYITAAACGVAGHQGGRAIGLLKVALSRRAGL